MATKASESTPTPDQMSRFHRKSRFDEAPHGTLGRSNEPQIVDNKLGPSCKMDSNKTGRNLGPESSLGAGGANLGAAARSIPSGAKAPCVDWGHIQRGGK